nr:PAS domain-containing protein [uncultured Desulfobulbus sp.]
MWEVHDDIRRQFRQTKDLLAGKDRSAARKALADLSDAVDDMVQKEERILFPMTLKILSEKDWHRCRLGEEEIGYAFDITPGDEWAVEMAEPVTSEPTTGLIDLATGQLSPEVVNAMLCNLPVDISFVDADDKVAYYSGSSHRIFPRSPAAIGRDVKNCHPPKSLHMVTEILEAFKKGERKHAEFCLELGEKFIHIQYLALHNQQGEYLGCLEVGHDATYVRSLRGQRRLLEWNSWDGHRSRMKTKSI